MLDKAVGAWIRSEIAFCYLFSDNSTEAKRLSEESLAIFKMLGEYNNMRALQASIVRAQCLVLEKQYDKAEKEFAHMEKCLLGSDYKGRFDQVAYGTSLYADFLKNKDDYSAAINAYNEVEKNWKRFGKEGIYNESVVLEHLAILQAAHKETRLAKQNLTKALSLIETSPDKTNIAKAKLCFRLSDIEWKEGKYLSAFMNRSEIKELLKSKN